MNFRTLFFALGLISFSGCTTVKFPSTGQCNDLVFDFKTGTLNGISPTASMEEVKKAFPCFTGESEEGGDFNCGGGVFFLDHNFFIYTFRNYIDIRSGFSGKLTKDVIGLTKQELVYLMGTPDETFGDKTDFSDYEISYYQYQKDWGTLAFFEENQVIKKVEAHYGKKPGEIDFCY